MKKPCFLYWIHLEKHKDVSEGYVGVSTNVLKRFSEHKHFAKTKGTYPLSKAILKHGDNLIVTTILEASRQYCLEIERKLRPSERLGWNLAVGGGVSVDRTGIPHTEQVKALIGEHSRRTSHTPAKKGVPRPTEVIANMKLGNKKKRAWNTSRADRQLWSRADEVYANHLKNPTFGAINLAIIMGLPKKSLLAIHTHIVKNNWCPNEDPAWVLWATEYKLKGNK